MGAALKSAPQFQDSCLPMPSEEQLLAGSSLALEIDIDSLRTKHFALEKPFSTKPSKLYVIEKRNIFTAERVRR